MLSAGGGGEEARTMVTDGCDCGRMLATATDPTTNEHAPPRGALRLRPENMDMNGMGTQNFMSRGSRRCCAVEQNVECTHEGTEITAPSSYREVDVVPP